MRITLTSGEEVRAEPGESLLAALKRAGIYLSASCGGKGACGKCRVRLHEGAVETEPSARLSARDREEGYLLACKASPSGDVLIEIPESSKLAVGDKIAASRALDLRENLERLGGGLLPLVKTVDLELPPPTVADNIGDLERIRRALESIDIPTLRISHSLALTLADTLRDHTWSISLGYFVRDCHTEIVFLRPRDGRGRFGIAVDIGTTTVVVYLVDLVSGEMKDVGSTYNSQMRHGDDVITRIVHATETPGRSGLRELTDAVLGDINDLTSVLLERHGIDRFDVVAASLSGNTTMKHLLWGLNPGPIREEPYIPTINFFPIWLARDARIKINPYAPVYSLPCVASYVGGDIVSGVLACGMHRGEEIVLFMDIGTNGEVAIGNKDWIVTAACSAGPCFEGSGIRHGMRATRGAIEEIRISPDTMLPELSVIGGGKPLGICGSGMIDAISEMFLRGLIDQRGRFRLDERHGSVRQGTDGPEYVFYEDALTTVALTEPDIENILRAKAAMYAGVSLLIKEVGLSLDAIDRVYIAGGFGSFLDIGKAIILGMLPDLPVERFAYKGNTSAAGAYLTLLSDDLRKEAGAIASMMTYVELSVSAGFMDEYMSAMFLPHTDMSQFPSVRKLLGL